MVTPASRSMTHPTSTAPERTTETTSELPAQTRSERRRGERREGGAAEGRRGRKRATVFGSVWRDAGAAALLLVAMAFAVAHIRPIFAGRERVGERILQTVAPGVGTTATRDSTREERMLASPEFQRDRSAFAADLVRTGRLSQERADSIAFYAVREAYTRGIPPALIFGVMLTENALFLSSAQSNVGAVGLMQVYPKIWLKELSKRFGHDLASDSTNLKYGTFILSQYVNPKGRQTVTEAQVRKGLLRYNGCVRGTNTPNCRNYPDKVKKYVEREAPALCGDKGFYDCIAKPFIAGLMGEDPEQVAKVP